MLVALLARPLARLWRPYNEGPNVQKGEAYADLGRAAVTEPLGVLKLWGGLHIQGKGSKTLSRHESVRHELDDCLRCQAFNSLFTLSIKWFCRSIAWKPDNLACS